MRQVLLVLVSVRCASSDSRASDRSQSVTVLVDVAAASLVATASLAGDEPLGGGEERFYSGGVDSDDGDKGFSDGPDSRGVDTIDVPVKSLEM